MRRRGDPGMSVGFRPLLFLHLPLSVSPSLSLRHHHRVVCAVLASEYPTRLGGVWGNAMDHLQKSAEAWPCLVPKRTISAAQYILLLSDAALLGR